LLNRLRKYLRLAAPDRRLLLEAALLQAAVRVALWCMPARTLRRTPRPASRDSQPAVSQLAWAVNAASSVIPRSTCLVRALAARRLLARHGYPSTLRLGVARTSDGLAAHAWLECQGAILIGAAPPGRYTPLPAQGTSATTASRTAT
jgi:hypothetical protein